MAKIKKSKNQLFLIILVTFIVITISIISLIKVRNNNKEIVNIDAPKTESCFTKDENGVYYNCGSFDNGKIEGLDPITFKEEANYALDKNKVFCCTVGCVQLEGADSKTFKSIADAYAKDKNNVYRNCEKIKVDYLTFKALNINYYMDKNGVYCSGLKIKNADINTFKVIDESNAIDKNNKYLDGQIVK
ncbi:MAG: DKNYY domain-containing protein [Candidatus Shapirobacteria bacterium]